MNEKFSKEVPFELAADGTQNLLTIPSCRG